MSDDESNDGVRVPPAKEGKSEEIFEVEQILNHKTTDNNLLLLVRWSGYDSSEDTWEPEEDLRDTAKEVVLEYYKVMKVNDKAELMATVDQHVERNNEQVKKNKKKRERTPSEKEDTSDSDESCSSPKPKKNRKTKKNPSSSSSTPRIETKASRKSYTTPKPVLAIPNNAKRAAMEIRDNRWGTDDSDNSETEAARPDDIERMQMKVRSKPSHVNVDKSGAGFAKRADPKEKSESPKIEEPSSSNTHKNKAQSETRGSSSHEQHNIDATPIVGKNSETSWTVKGIVLHGEDRSNRKKMVLMKNSITGQKSVFTAEDAFKLGGWALTKYLFDRCEI